MLSGGMASRSNARRRALGWLGALAGGVWGMSCLAGCTAARAEESTRAKQQKAALDVSERSRDVDAGSLVEPAWQIELGSAVTSVVSSGIVADAAGDVLVSGYTLGALEDGSVLASSDAFLAKYSAMGELRWAAALASADSDTAAGASTDSAGNVFIAGDTSGALDGAAQGRGDAFVARYSPEGALEWTRQLGTLQPDAASGVSADARGDVFITGVTRGTLAGSRQGSDADVWVAKYSSAGEPIWCRQFGSSPGYDERAAGVSAGADGSVFVAGHTFGGLEGDGQGSADAFVAKLSEQGELLWMHQLGGTDYDAAEAVRADGSGNVYVSGQMGGVLAGGPGVVLPGHPFAAKYSSGGDLLWLLELEEGALGSATSVSTDGDGNAFIAGYTSAEWGGPHRGLYDSFVARLSADGELLWVLQPGVEQLDQASGVSADSSGHVYVSRNVWNFGTDGSDQAFVSRFGTVPMSDGL